MWIVLGLIALLAGYILRQDARHAPAMRAGEAYAALRGLPLTAVMQGLLARAIHDAEERIGVVPTTSDMSAERTEQLQYHVR